MGYLAIWTVFSAPAALRPVPPREGGVCAAGVMPRPELLTAISLPPSPLRPVAPSSRSGWAPEGVPYCDSAPLPAHPRWGPGREGLETRLWLSRFHSNRAVVFANPLQSSTLFTPDRGPGSEPRGAVQMGCSPPPSSRLPGRSARAGGRGALLRPGLWPPGPHLKPRLPLRPSGANHAKPAPGEVGLMQIVSPPRDTSDTGAGRRLQRGSWGTWPPTHEPISIPESS